MENNTKFIRTVVETMYTIIKILIDMRTFGGFN